MSDPPPSSTMANPNLRRPTTSSGTNSTLSDLTCSVRRTNAAREIDRPPPLVGCSVTRISNDVYVFGGRLVPTRTMVATLYRLSLETLTWELLWPPPSSSTGTTTTPGVVAGGGEEAAEEENGGGEKKRGPVPRYFHSADAWAHKLVIFAGEGYSPSSSSTSSRSPSPSPVASSTDDEPEPDSSPLCTLDDVCVWDTIKGVWEFPRVGCEEGVERPAARYAHLGVISRCSTKVEGDFDIPFGSPSVAGGDDEEEEEEGMKSLLIILGGQDINNTYLSSLNVLDLERMTWIKAGRWEKHIGTYRAVAMAASRGVVARSRKDSTSKGSGIGMEGPTRAAPMHPAASSSSSSWAESSETILHHQSHSVTPTLDRPEPIFVFSNYNFTDVRRDFDVLAFPLPPSHALETTSLSRRMVETSHNPLPPGLRFPTGTMVGRHVVVFGTSLSASSNTFSIWSLDLGAAGGAGVIDSLAREKEGGGKKEREMTMGWTKIDAGSAMSQGSWNRAVGWENKIVVLGDRERDIAVDYDHRQTNFAHLALIDLEAFGIYHPPPLALSPTAQSFGLDTFSLPHPADFEIICSDGKRIACSRGLLSERWGWFGERVDEFRASAAGIVGAQRKRLEAVAVAGEGTKDSSSSSAAAGGVRLTPRTLDLPETSSTVIAFLQYLHTFALSTALHQSLPIVVALLAFSTTYNERHLRALCVHGMHEWLEDQMTSGSGGGGGGGNTGTGTVAIYEAATLNSCHALQIRALKIMMGGARRSNPATTTTTTTTTTPRSTTAGSNRAIDDGASNGVGKAVAVRI